MAMRAGRCALSAQQGRITLFTSRDGLAAQAGHDLTIDVGRWSGELTVAADGAPSGLEIRAELSSLTVRAGTGGLKPLSDRDKREIIGTARKTLRADQHPQATFTASGFTPAAGGATIDGTFTLAGRPAPLRLQVRESAPGRYTATGTVLHSSHGLRPYSGFLGALRVSDPVKVEAEVDLTALLAPEPAG